MHVSSRFTQRLQVGRCSSHCSILLAILMVILSIVDWFGWSRVLSPQQSIVTAISVADLDVSFFALNASFSGFRVTTTGHFDR